jgi:glycogenin glucosyltransferase
MAAEDGVYITLVTSDAYAVGACVLAKSLRESGTTRAIWCLAGSLGTNSRLSPTTVQLLRRVFEGNVIETESLDSADTRNLALLGRPDLGSTFTKLRLWQLTQFRKLVYLDADTLVLKNIDELFERDEFSAAPDAGWPDCFNSGVFVAEPRTETYVSLMNLARDEGSFDGGDQGILNTHFPNWNRIPFAFNMTINSSYSYAPAFARYGSDVRVVHFIGANKPWTLQRNSDGSVMTGRAQHEASIAFLNAWWSVYDRLNAETPLETVSLGPGLNGESFGSGLGIASQQAS